MKKTQLKIGIFIISCMAVALTYSFAYDLFMHFYSISWLPTHARVIEIRETTPKSTDLIYEYYIDEKKFTGNTFVFISPGSLHEKQLIENNYIPEEKITVFVNPSNPSQSVVLKRNLRLEYIRGQLIFIPLLIFLVIHFYMEYKYITSKSRSLTPTRWDVQN